MDRTAIAHHIAQRLTADHTALKEAFATAGPIGYFAVDNVLPSALAQQIAVAFPPVKELKEKQTLREHKYISSQMNQHDSLLEEALFAFQAPEVVGAIQAIIAHPTLYPDPMLYAGGISRMEENGFLNPHIDNSHDKDRKRWRSVNLLYYVSPGWRAAFGGNLELWPNGTRDAPITIESAFNRLVIMATHQHSWHSVSPIRVPKSRCCISNYYFSDTPMHPKQHFHVTSFRGRPEQPLTDMALRADAFLRNGLRKLKSGGFFQTGHWYKKESMARL